MFDAAAPQVGRAYASACYLRGSIYLFGGCNGTVASSYRSDLAVLSLEHLTWTKCVANSPEPAGRAQHTMVASGGLLYVFGGGNLKHGRKNALGDLQTFNPIKKQWTLLVGKKQLTLPVGKKQWTLLAGKKQWTRLVGTSRP